MNMYLNMQMSFFGTDAVALPLLLLLLRRVVVVVVVVVVGRGSRRRFRIAVVDAVVHDVAG